MITGLSSCSTQSFRKEMKAKETVAKNYHHSAFRPRSTIKATPLSWQAGSSSLLRNNTVIQSSQLRLDELLDKKNNFWLRELAPRISTFLSLRLELDELAKLSSENLTATAFLNLPSPNPFSLYQRAYSLDLQLYQAVHQHELLKRQQLANLYRLFTRFHENELQLHTLHKTLNEAKESNDYRQLKKIYSIEEQIERSKRMKIDTELSLNKILNTPGKRWKPQPHTLPNISYSNKLNRLTLENRFGNLSVKLAAAGLHATSLGIKSIEFEKIPRASLSVSSPSIYNSTTDDGLGLDTANMNLFTSLSKTFTFNGSNRLRKTNIKKRAAMATEALKLSMEREAHILSSARATHLKLSQKIIELSKEIRAIENSQRTNAVALKQQWRQLETSQRALKQLKLQRTQLDLQFWIWDDTKWPAIKDPTEPKPKPKKKQ